jgi:hypothetical protein
MHIYIRAPEEPVDQLVRYKKYFIVKNPSRVLIQLLPRFKRTFDYEWWKHQQKNLKNCFYSMEIYC